MKTNLKKQEYRGYLGTAHWKAFREKIYSKRRSCENCGAHWKLNVHHLNYDHLWDERETDVVVLCERCHYAIHPEKRTSYTVKSFPRFIKRKFLSKKKRKKFHIYSDKQLIRKLGTVGYYRMKREKEKPSQKLSFPTGSTMGAVYIPTGTVRRR